MVESLLNTSLKTNKYEYKYEKENLQLLFPVKLSLS